jgi:hypothetical protein
LTRLLAEVRHQTPNFDILLSVSSVTDFFSTWGDRKRDVVQTNLLEVRLFS